MIKATMIALIMRVAGTAFWLVYTVALARLLPAQDFGTVLYAINLALILAPVATLGFETSTLKHASVYWAAGRKATFAGMLRQSRRMALFGGLIFATVLIIGTVSGVSTPVTLDPTITLLTGAAVLLAALMGIHRDTLRAADRLIAAFFGLSILRTLGPLLGAGVLYGMDILSAQTALMVFVISLICAVLVEGWMIRRLHLPAPELVDHEVAAHTQVARGTWVGDMAHVVLMRGPTVCLGFLIAPEILALYLAAERIANLGQFLTDAVRTAAAPPLAQAFQDMDDTTRKASALKDVSRLMLKSGVMDALLLAAIAYPALWAMGPQFTQVAPVIGLFILVQLGWTIPGPTAMVMNMAGLEHLRTFWTLLAAGALILGTFLLVPVTAPWMALIVQAVVVWSLNLWQVWQIRRDRAVWSGIFAWRAV